MSNKAEKVLNDILENKEVITMSLSLALSLIQYGSEMLKTITDKELSEDELLELIEKYKGSRDKAINDMDAAIAAQKVRKSQ